MDRVVQQGAQLRLLRQAVRGDSEALAQLLREHDPSLRRRLQAQLPRRFAALLGIDDLLQETYTDVFLGIADFAPRGVGSFENWLFKIAQNNLRGTIRDLEAEKRGGRRRHFSTASVDESFLGLHRMVSGSGSTPSGAASRLEAKAAIKAAVAQLPETYRQVVQAYDLEGQTAAELAASLGRSPGAVFMLRTRAHRLLRALLETPQRRFSDFA